MQRVYIHALPVRIWHWTNALGCTLLALTGIQIRYIGTINVLPFRIVVMAHNAIGLVISANFFLWFFYYLTSPKIRNYLPDLHLVRFFAARCASRCFTLMACSRENPIHTTSACTASSIRCRL